MISIGHFFTGYTVTLSGLILSGKHLHLKHDAIIAGVGGFLAMVPDFYHILPEGDMRDAWKEFHDSGLANLFFGHQWLDRWDAKDEPIKAMIPIALSVIPTGILIWKERKQRILLQHEQMLLPKTTSHGSSIPEEALDAEEIPIPYTPVKRLKRNDVLYVTEEFVRHPIHGYAEGRKVYGVIDLRGYRRGYEPRLEIRGVYTPNPDDVFRLGTGHLPPYQPITTGDKLLGEMRRLGVHKAWRIKTSGPTPELAAGMPHHVLERNLQLKHPKWDIQLFGSEGERVTAEAQPKDAKYREGIITKKGERFYEVAKALDIAIKEKT